MSATIINGVLITIYNVGRSTAVNVSTFQIVEAKENCNEISEDISLKDSLTNAYNVSKEKGFTSNVNVLYFNQEEPLAQAR